MKTIQVKKGEILQHAGEPIKFGYKVNKGLLRSYTIDEKGKEHVFIFAPEGWYISDMDAQINGGNTELFIDALEDSELEATPSSDFNLDQLVTTNEDTVRLIKRAAVLQRRVIMLMSASARERYEHFIKTYKTIVNRVPQRMIATYLGITPEALSKIRGEMAREK